MREMMAEHMRVVDTMREKYENARAGVELAQQHATRATQGRAALPPLALQRALELELRQAEAQPAGRAPRRKKTQSSKNTSSFCTIS